MSPVRALLVDDSAEFLQAARSLLEGEGIAVVATASNGAEAVRRAEEHALDVVLVDIGLGDESGFDVAERLSGADGRWQVLLISTFPEQDFADLIDASPALGFVSKSQLSADAITRALGRG